MRSIAAGERPTELPDWANIVEKIRSVGNEALFAVQSLLVQAMLHMLKAETWPLSRDVDHWRPEARRFRGDAAARFAPSMRQRIDLPKLYRRALRAIPERIDGQAPLPVPGVCPVTLDELVAE